MPKKAPEKIGSVLRVPLSQLHPHPQNPFAVRDDSAMQELKESVSQNGVLVPAIARPRAEGGYELIAGHRRKYACEQAGQDSMPVIVLNLNDDEAVIQLVDSNIQREDILPSERARAYKMKMDAIKRQGARTDLTSPNGSAKFRSDDLIGEKDGVSGDTVRNYIGYDMHNSAGTSYYYMAADASGRSAIFEWANGTDDTDLDGSARQLVITYNDQDSYIGQAEGDSDFQWVTNFVIQPSYYDNEEDRKDLDRYQHIYERLAGIEGTVADEKGAMDILASVGRRSWNSNGEHLTVHSVIYNLSKKNSLLGAK